MLLFEIRLHAPGAGKRKAARSIRGGIFPAETLFRNLTFRTSSLRLKAPWRLPARLPDPGTPRSLLMRWCHYPELAANSQEIIGIWACDKFVGRQVSWPVALRLPSAINLSAVPGSSSA